MPLVEQRPAVSPDEAADAASDGARPGGRIVRDFLFLSGSRYLGTVLGILRGLVVPKLLDPALYGLFKSYQTLSELSRMATLGVPSALFRELPIAQTKNQEDRSQHLLDNGFWSTVLSAVPFAIALLVGGLTGWIHFQDVQFTPWYVLFIPLLFVDRTKIFFDVVFTGQKQFVFQAKLRFFDEVATTLLTIAAAWLYGFDGFLVSMLLVNGLVTGVGWWGSRYRIRHALDLPLAKEMIVLGFPQLLVGLSNTVYNQLDRMAIVGAGLGMTAVGWYSVGMTINEQLAYTAQIIGRVIMPRMMEHYGRAENVEDIRKFVIPPIRLAGLGYAALIVLCALAGDVVFSVWLPKYAAGLAPMKIMLVGTYFLSMLSSVHPFFLAVKKQRYLLYTFLATIPIACGLLVLAVLLKTGLNGIAVATAITDFLLATAALWIVLGFFIGSRLERAKEIARAYSPLAFSFAAWIVAELVRRAAGLQDDAVRGAALSGAVFCVLFVAPVILILRTRGGRRVFGWDDLHDR